MLPSEAVGACHPQAETAEAKAIHQCWCDLIVQRGQPEQQQGRSGLQLRRPISVTGAPGSQSLD